MRKTGRFDPLQDEGMGCFIGCHTGMNPMGDERQHRQERRVSVEDMPEEVQRFADTMLGLDPSWNIEAWLVEQATMGMNLLAADLIREKVMIEQRLARLEQLGRRLDVDDTTVRDDPYQRNLFDCFDLNEAHPLRGLGERAIEQPPADAEPSPHPSSVFLDLLPHDNTDDPLLAIAAQSILMGIEHEMRSGDGVATLETIFQQARHIGIADEETDEALNHLLMLGTVVEVDDDCFVAIDP